MHSPSHLVAACHRPVAPPSFPVLVAGSKEVNSLMESSTRVIPQGLDILFDIPKKDGLTVFLHVARTVRIAPERVIDG